MVRSPGQPVRYLPFALDLYYLLSTYSEASYVEEQQAMSVALRIFHANAVVRSGPASPPAVTPPAWQLTLTMEHRSYDELSRLWQATTVPVRLGVVYRAAVLFITPDEPLIAAEPARDPRGDRVEPAHREPGHRAPRAPRAPLARPPSLHIGAIEVTVAPAQQPQVPPVTVVETAPPRAEPRPLQRPGLAPWYGLGQR